MIIPVVISHTVFDFTGLNSSEQLQKYNNLLLFLQIFLKRSVLILDNKNFINSNILQNIYEISDENIRLKLLRFYKTIFLNYSQKVKIKNVIEENIEQCCGIFLSLLVEEDSNGIYCNVQDCSNTTCTNCLMSNGNSLNLVDINSYAESALFKEMNKSNYIINEQDNLDNFKISFINNFIKYTNNIVIYDKQISSLNQNTYDISENIKRNLKYWISYFYNINNNVNIKILTSIKDKANATQTKRKLVELSNIIKGDINIDNFCIEIIDKELHQRYFCSDKLVFACDKGIDLIKENETLVDNLHLAIIDSDEAIKIRQVLNCTNY